MTTLLTLAYLACAVATYGWIHAHYAVTFRWTKWGARIISALMAALWPIAVLTGVFWLKVFGDPLWAGWRLR